MIYKRGDVFCTKGTSFLARAIRFLSRGWGEARTEVNHVGIVVQGGPPTAGARGAITIDAMSRVLWRPLIEQKSPCIVFRPLNLTEEELDIIVEKALSYRARRYGYVKIATHFLDWCLGGAYVFRHLTQSDRYPICSWVIAQAYAEADKTFGVKPGQAQPDDIYDFCMENGDKYEIVHPLTVL